VPRLVRVTGQVVQLGEGKVDELEAVAGQARERRPAAVDGRGERLEVARLWRGAAARGQGQQAAARKAVRDRQTQRVQHGGQDVDVPHTFAHDARIDHARR